MEEDIYIFSDSVISQRIGRRIRQMRLRQNITQMSLAEQAQISVSSVKKMEKGKIGSFESFLRILRILGELDILTPLMKEEELSPNEYLEVVETLKRKQRQRAASQHIETVKNNQEEEW